jgi:nitrite reductase (NO-forming)
MPTHADPPVEQAGLSPTAVGLSIFFGGLSLLAVLVIWAMTQSHGPSIAVAAPAVPAATANVAAASGTAGMKGMAGMDATAPAATPSAAAATTSTGAAATVSAHQAVDATLPPVGAGTVHHYTIRLADEILDIAPGVRYQGWTFEGASPGPVIHVRQGDWVDITLVNGGSIPHSIDFHAALTAPETSFKTIPKGASVHFRFRAETAGAFMYHCGTPPVLAHIANGMYGAIIVDPKAAMPIVQKSYVLVSGEWYLTGDGKTQPATLDFEKARQMRPDYVTFNGYADQYKDAPLTADPGDTVRFYVVDAGPSLDTDFHVVGAILDRVYLDGTTTDVLHGVQTQLVPPGGGMIFDVTFRTAGIYPFVSHSFAAVDMGELGLVNVGNVAGSMSH